ncbi:MAG: RDD family protein [Candidatus Cyclobacteriaceae bacterium M3_2C_046]
MQKVSIETTQNVQIDFQIASLGDRILAFLIDAGIQFLYIMIMIIMFSSIIPSLEQQVETFILVLILLMLPVMFYHLLFEIFMNGQSIGKKQMKIKVVKLDGSQPSIGSYLLRWIFRIIDSFFYYGVAMLIISTRGKGQRLGDIVAGTTVIKMARTVDLGFHKQTDHPEDDYEPIFPQVTRLSDRDIGIIRTALDVYRDTANIQPVLATEAKIKQLLQVESQMPPVKFLSVIIKDHNYLMDKI